jgi:uncharacterized protein (TIGR00255 family)
MIRSMTGYACVQGAPDGQRRLQVEIRSLNHRNLDLKLRLPRELQAVEHLARDWLSSQFIRGAVECRAEWIAELGMVEGLPEPNMALAAHYYESLIKLQKALGLTDAIQTRDLLAFGEIFSKSQTNEIRPEPAALWESIKPVFEEAVRALQKMRAAEGEKLLEVLRTTRKTLLEKIATLDVLRKKSADAIREKTFTRTREVFEAHPISDPTVKSVLESRLAQELALLLDRTDIEEELVRFRNHLEHMEKILSAGGPCGKKLDFVFQELHREINTLGNKAQDYGMSEHVVDAKVRIEQMREQTMNVE